ncbi:hypothetical protein JOF56_010390 [Kibdelosporangium banguiense]|uniref:Sulfotransferase family protein n=1 Tax=Kibdelosporangium banguiense TaxID=1365924 RepID=A0ABS4U1D3_9PSEU|nr:sulfotransferase [Kibdelosporangium banguiense]MBP2330005.1 hypothetical protein [Kibdelosporangium banguiense]
MDSSRVLYVTGWCRSGTTLIGNLLNELDGVVHVGELYYLWRNGVLRDGTNSTCGCGTPVLQCPVWRDVLEQVGGVDLVGTARAWMRAQQQLVRTRHTMARLAESSGRKTAPPAVRQLGDRMNGLYQAIRGATGARVVVDSSKYPAEAALLAGRQETNIRILHVVRDPRATANSWLRPKLYIPAMSPARSTLYWTGFNAASELICRMFPEISLRLTYEDFVRDPRRALRAILGLLDLDAEPPVDANRIASLGINHTVTGNPDRLQRGDVQVRPDDRWPAQLPRRAAVTATALSLPLLTRYGYPVTPSSKASAVRQGV